jgi:hypothetical protein
MKKNIIASILLLIILVSCSPPKTEIPIQPTDFTTEYPTHAVVEMPSIGDGGLLSGEPCASPCFFEIRIGETPLQQVIPTLEHYGVSPCVQYDETNVPCGIGFFANAWLTIDSSTSIVNGIGYDPSIRISVKDIIEKYDTPNSVQVELDNAGTPELPTLRISLLWDALKMAVDLPENSDGEWEFYVIENTTEVWWINFSNDAYYFGLTTNEYPQPWKGYGTYEP